MKWVIWNCRLGNWASSKSGLDIWFLRCL